MILTYRHRIPEMPLRPREPRLSEQPCCMNNATKRHDVLL
jgi:hypothetical protein